MSRRARGVFGVLLAVLASLVILSEIGIVRLFQRSSQMEEAGEE